MNPEITMTGSVHSYQKRPGGGAIRAAKRLAEHRAGFAHIDMTPVPSRQQRRAAERASFKGGLHNAKMAAMQARKPGGAAAVR
jgi:hypothetical protein